MNAKHTPGPWHNNGGFIIADSGADVASTPKHNVKVDRLDQHRADATLIAAAPTMLELLKQVSVELKRNLVSGGMEITVAECNNLDELVVDIDQAIAKAEGRA